MWSLPLDPIIFKDLLDQFQDAQVEEPVWDWIEGLRQEQRKLAEALADTSPLQTEERELWPFQRSDARAAVLCERMILGHKMGLGKTVIACQAIKETPVKRVLIICPDAVKYSWCDHLHDWANWEEPVVVFETGGKKLAERRNNGDLVYKGNRAVREEFLEQMLQAEEQFAIVLNYDQMRLHIDTLAASYYDVIIYDEAHRLKNSQAQRTQAAYQLVDRSTYLWLLTGTPTRNSWEDVWSLLYMVNPKRFSSKWNFIKTYLDWQPGIWGGIDIFGPKDQEEFNKALARHIIYRTKEEVAPHLPKKIYSDYRVQFAPGQEKAYQKMEKDFVALVKQQMEDGQEIHQILQAPNTVSQMIRLRQICCSPAIIDGEPKSGKLNIMADLLEDVLQDGPVVIFSCFKRFLPFIGQILRKMGVEHGYITGDYSNQERAQVAQQLGNGLQVALGTPQAMGEGLNLDAAHTAIFTDLDWVPAVNEQAEDRIHRITTKQPPNIIRLYHPKTVEADIRQVLKRKEGIIESSVGQLETLRQMLQRRK